MSSAHLVREGSLLLLRGSSRENPAFPPYCRGIVFSVTDGAVSIFWESGRRAEHTRREIDSAIRSGYLKVEVY